jgi:hypothetical protein
MEITLCVEIGHGERQQTVGEDCLQFLWIHYSNTLAKTFYREVVVGFGYVIRHRTTIKYFVNCNSSAFIEPPAETERVDVGFFSSMLE